MLRHAVYYCGRVTQRSKFLLAALTSAVRPELVVAGVSDSAQSNGEDQRLGIDQAVVQDTAGTRYDVLATDTDDGRKRLAGRVDAAQRLEKARETNALSFAVDKVLAYADGTEGTGPTGFHSVLIAKHRAGQSRPLELLTLDDCAAMGTAIGAIHRLPTTVLRDSHYPKITTEQIRSQLVAWIDRLNHAGHVPHEITDSWARIIDTEGLWAFHTCFVHGGFHDGDVLFTGSTITAITNWQDMQVNDPARDLAWMFSALDEGHRNALMSAYGRMRGARLDSLIMLRANLWLQMEQVGEFIEALSHADNTKIMEFKARVERLAHQLGATRARPSSTTARHAAPNGSTAKPPSTITVGSLLADERDDSTASRDIQPAASFHGGPAEVAADDATNDTGRPVSDQETIRDDTSRTVIVEGPIMATSYTERLTDPASATMVIPEVDGQANAERDMREGLGLDHGSTNEHENGEHGNGDGYRQEDPDDTNDPDNTNDADDTNDSARIDDSRIINDPDDTNDATARQTTASDRGANQRDTNK